MGAQLRVYKRRIQAVTATKKITKAMEMIAASRIVKAQRKVAASQPYATELTRAVTAVATGSDANHPLTTEVETPTRPRSCSSRATAVWPAVTPPTPSRPRSDCRERLASEGEEVDTYIVGRKGVAYYGFRERKVADSWTGFTDNPAYSDAKRIAALR